MGNYPISDLIDDDLADDDLTENKDDADTFFGKVDATIHGSPIALMKLGSADNAGASMLDSDVVIDGDMRVAEKFSAILKEVDIDWEELFSKLVGDIFAHQAGDVVRSGSDWFKESVEAMKLNTSEYLSEESKLTPAEAEIDYFMDQVDDLRMDLDRLIARVNNLKASIDNKNENTGEEPQDNK